MNHMNQQKERYEASSMLFTSQKWRARDEGTCWYGIMNILVQ